MLKSKLTLGTRTDQHTHAEVQWAQEEIYVILWQSEEVDCVMQNVSFLFRRHCCGGIAERSA